MACVVDATLGFSYGHGHLAPGFCPSPRPPRHLLVDRTLGQATYDPAHNNYGLNLECFRHFTKLAMHNLA